MEAFGEVDERIVLEESKEAMFGCIMLQLSLKRLKSGESKERRVP